MAERHMPFFRLLEAAQQPGCALCRLIGGRTRRRLSRLLEEHVNDGGVRADWRAAHGVCHRHAWMLAESGDSLGLGILYHDLVKSHGLKLLLDAPGGQCPICREEERVLREYLDEMELHVADDDLRSALDGGDGLCGPHLRFALEFVKKEPLRRLLCDISQRAIAALEADLSCLIESFDYLHDKPKDERVKSAWCRAIELTVGIRDVPGFELKT